MSTLLRAGLAAGLLTAALAAPASAYGCMPHIYDHTVEAGGQTVTYYTVQMIC